MGAFFLRRINDVMQDLRKIKAALDGTGEFAAADYRNCLLGEWLYGAGAAEAAAVGPAATAIFNALFEPHRAFHLASERALARMAAGRLDLADREVTEMHRLSSTLTNRLLELDGLATSG